MDGEQGTPHGFSGRDSAPANEKGDSPSCTETFRIIKVRFALARSEKILISLSLAPLDSVNALPLRIRIPSEVVSSRGIPVAGGIEVVSAHVLPLCWSKFEALLTNVPLIASMPCLRGPRGEVPSPPISMLQASVPFDAIGLGIILQCQLSGIAFLDDFQNIFSRRLVIPKFDKDVPRIFMTYFSARYYVE